MEKTPFQLWKEALGFTNTSLALTLVAVLAVNLTVVFLGVKVAVWALRAAGVGV